MRPCMRLTRAGPRRHCLDRNASETNQRPGKINRGGDRAQDTAPGPVCRGRTAVGSVLFPLEPHAQSLGSTLVEQPQRPVARKKKPIVLLAMWPTPPGVILPFDGCAGLPCGRRRQPRRRDGTGSEEAWISSLFGALLLKERDLCVLLKRTHTKKTIALIVSALCFAQLKNE